MKQPESGLILLLVGVGNHVWGKMDVGEKALYGDFFAKSESEPGSEWLWDADGTRDAAPWGCDNAMDVRDGPNLYAYCVQNPWTKFDPEGLFEDGFADGMAYVQMSSEGQQQYLDRRADRLMVGITALAVFTWNLVLGIGEMNDLAEAEKYPEGSRQCALYEFSARMGVLTAGLLPNRSGIQRALNVIADSLEADAVRGAREAAEATAKAQLQAAEELMAKLEKQKQDALLEKPHGNTAGDQEAVLYERYDKDGNFQKHGVTADMDKRNTRKELDGGVLVEVDRGPRKEMLKEERIKTETDPGHLNKEPWAGKRADESN